MYISGWWFGSFFIFHSVGNHHPNWLSLHHFSEGRAQPPTRYVCVYSITQWYIGQSIMFTTIPPASFVMAFLGFLPRTGGGDLGILRGALQWPLLLYDLGSSLAGRLAGGDFSPRPSQSRGRSGELFWGAKLSDFCWISTKSSQPFFGSSVRFKQQQNGWSIAPNSCSCF